MVSKAPVYESAALALDASHEPVLYADFKAPRDVRAEDVRAMLDMSDRFVLRRAPFVPLVQLRKGTGIISSEARGMFADWIERRARELQRKDVCLVIVIPESIFRAVLRVVYRFRESPIRTITVSDIASASELVRGELATMGCALKPELQRFLTSIAETRRETNLAQG